MNLATVFELLSGVAGLFSGAFFCVGVLHLKSESVEAIAFSMWNKGFTIATELVSQKWDFIAGAVLLFFAFGLQFPIKVWPEAFQIPVFDTALFGVAASVAGATALAVVLRTVCVRMARNAINALAEQRKTKG